MILNILPIIQRIRQTDFTSVSTAKARAMYGILSQLMSWVEDGDDLVLRLLESQPDGFLQDEQTIDGYEQSDILWRTLPLKERLLRLQAFYQTDIHQLSAGDDQKSRQFLTAAERTFEQCRKESFDFCDSRMEEYLLYFHVLCLVHPGYRCPGHVRLYLDYNRFFDALPIEQYDEDSDLAWQYREVRWQRDMLHEQHFDQSLQSPLSFADEAACREFRLQCYRWMADLDPEDDHTIQTQEQNGRFATEGVRKVFEWLHAKYVNDVKLLPEEEATALLTIYCGMNTGLCDPPFLADIEAPTYRLLAHLPASKLRTHLMAQAGYYHDNADLIKTAHAALATWPPSQLTPEDQYLQELVK